MSRDYIPLYEGALKGNRVGSFSRNGLIIDIIKPGYDCQGRRRQSWTQFVVDGVPIWEWKVQCDLSVAMRNFDELWNKYIASEPGVLEKALENCRRDHVTKFCDGVSGESPAPALTRDGRPDGKQYPS